MKKIIKRIGVIFLLLSILLTSCGRTDTENGNSSDTDEVKSIDLNGYTIIRGENEDVDIISAISEFYFSLKNDHKIDISMGVDQEVNESEKEIIFGATNRSEDKKLPKLSKRKE